MSFPRYPKYKDSGVEWLGEVPEHWEVRPNKAVMTLLKREVGSAWSDTELLSLTLRGVVLRDIESGVGKYPSDFSTYQMVEPRDLVFCLFDMDETPRTIGISPHRGMITAAYDVFHCNNDANAAFVCYFYMHVDAQKGLRPFYTGLRKTVRIPTFLSIKVPFPPEHEQRAIAAFLDRETAKIDALIAEQQRLIELLQEKRQAVISHAVTKGLNPDVPMKDSGIEWLGEVPEHWEVVSVRRILAAIDQGWSPQCDSRAADLNEWGILKTGCVNHGFFSEEENKALPSDLEPIYEYEVNAGDVLMSRASGSPELVGATAYVHEVRPRLMLSDKTFRIHVTDKISPQFFVAVFNSQTMRAQIAQSISGADGLANNLPQSKLRGFVLALPPVEEQAEVLEEVSTRCDEYDALKAQAERAITLLQERRSALISAAVTGRIDVRGLAGSEAA